MKFLSHFTAACLVLAVYSQEEIKNLEISCRDFKYKVTWNKLTTSQDQAISYTLLKLERRRTIEIRTCANLTTTSCTMTTNLHYLHLNHVFQVRAIMTDGKIARSNVVYYIPLDGKFTLSPPKLEIERNGGNLTVVLSEPVIPWLGKTVTEVLEKYRSDFEVQYYADVYNRTNHTFWTKKNRTTLITSLSESQQVCVRAAIKYERWGEIRTGEWVKKCIPGITSTNQYSQKWHIALPIILGAIFVLACGLVLGCTPIGRKAYRYTFSIRKVTTRPSIVIDIDDTAPDELNHPSEFAEKTPEKIFKKLYVRGQSSTERQCGDQSAPLIRIDNKQDELFHMAGKYADNQEIVNVNRHIEELDDVESEDSFHLLKQTLSLQSYITEDDLRRMKLKEKERMELQGACASAKSVCGVIVSNDEMSVEIVRHSYVNGTMSLAGNQTTDSTKEEASTKSEKLRLNSDDSAFFEDPEASVRSSTSEHYENLPRAAVKECQTSPDFSKKDLVFEFSDGYEQMALSTTANGSGRFPGLRYQNTSFHEIDSSSPYIAIDS